MTFQVFTFDQRSPEWFAARAGIPTASEFGTVFAKGKDGGASKTRRSYMLKLAGERVTGRPMENFTNVHMERGIEQEEEARDLYEFLSDEPVTRVGFIRNDEFQAGASPDALVGDKGLAEYKSALPHILIDHLLSGDFPSEHKAQCQGGLWIAEREWIDLQIYCPRMKPFTKRATRDEAYIKTLAAAVRQFNDELAEVVEKVRRYGAPSTLRADLVASNILMAG